MDPIVVIIEDGQQQIIPVDNIDEGDYVARKATGRHPNQKVEGIVDGYHNIGYFSKDVQAFVIDDSQLEK